ncbi:histidinol dehydrogenase [Amnibacterium flavum]|uniref:Histidinol dehydrogenase n=1 Tax=Amnibacterium flavum TaxID=2173173 RepID=A0A2V1HUF1_9MICO|nr:histidinol dehydrogenase [Amnibacterium flavum]PVZ94669.1 histidinol dehydrogenase [Amnibacterium flavum]
MMHLLDLRGQATTRAELLALVPRAQVDPASAAKSAASLIDEVRVRGSAALLDQAERFDGIRPESLRVSSEDIAAAVAALDPGVRTALEAAIERVREGSRAQVPGPTVTVVADGAEVRQRFVPVSRVGLYVPGGKAVYPSSVVMNVVPAQVAGVGSIALVSPPQKAFGGSVHPVVLGAAGLLGIDEVYAIGGAGAIGALAYGVPDLGLDPVDVITGPGNVFVAAAKRLVAGRVGIDSEAGPTEILVLADRSADPRLVAHDLISQAEHDELAAAILVTDSEELADAVQAALPGLVAATAAAGRVEIALTGVQSAVVLVDDLGAGAAFSNAYGPEHLELVTADPEATLELIENAGAVFVGESSPVSLGDYLAGSNHVLPTGGASRFSSALGAHTFLRSQQVVKYDRPALHEVADRIVTLAEAEGLPAHGEAVAARFS